MLSLRKIWIARSGVGFSKSESLSNRSFPKLKTMLFSNKSPHKFWDKVSGRRSAGSPTAGPLVDCLNGAFGKHILPGDRVLDYGCGTGEITLRIARRAERVHGVDISEGMLVKARQKVPDGFSGHISFNRITDLKGVFDDGSFQVVTAFNVMQYIENRCCLFDEFHRLLAPEGKLILAVPCFGDAGRPVVAAVKLLKALGVRPESYSFGGDMIGNELMESGFGVIESVLMSRLPERFIVAQKTG